MKRNKKGFTIVELVIVIAVIAILSAILIPTFVNLTDKANNARASQEVADAYTVYVLDAADGKVGESGPALPTGLQEQVLIKRLGDSHIYKYEKSGEEFKWADKGAEFATTDYTLVKDSEEAAVKYNECNVYYLASLAS